MVPDVTMVRSDPTVAPNARGSAGSSVLPDDLLGSASVGSGIPGSSRSRARGRLGTPGRMRLHGVLVALVCLGFGIVGGVAATSSVGAMDRAQADTEQIVRAQAIAAELFKADAVATNAYLVAGEEKPSQRAAYDAALDAATSQLAAATAAQPADAAVLGELNARLTSYAELVEHARADNRQGLPMGQRYQQLASTQLRAEALPLATAVVEANAKRLGASGGGEIGWPAVQATIQAVALLLTLLALGSLWVWLASRTRRRLSREIATACAIVLLSGVVGLGVQLATVARMHDFSSGVIRRAMLAAEARTSAYDARAAESLALIARGSGAGYEAAFSDSVDEVRHAQAELEVSRDPLVAYLARHAQIRSLDVDRGDWKAAVALAVDPSGFAPLERQLNEQNSHEVAQATDSLRSHGALQHLRWLLPLCGLAAAMLVLRGTELRAADYR